MNVNVFLLNKKLKYCTLTSFCASHSIKQADAILLAANLIKTVYMLYTKGAARIFIFQ